MDRWCDMEEEWSPNPYQAEEDGDSTETLQQMSEAHPSNERGASRQGKTLKHARSSPWPCSRDASVTHFGSCDSPNAQPFPNSFDHNAEESVHERGTAMGSGYARRDAWAARTQRVDTLTPYDHIFEHSLEASAVRESHLVSGVQPQAEVWQLTMSQSPRGLPLYQVSHEASLPAFDATFHGFSSGEGTHSGDGTSSGEGATEPATRTDEGSETYRTDSNIRHSRASNQYSDYGVPTEQEAASSSDSPAETWNLYEIRAAPERPSQIQWNEDKIDSNPSMGMHTWSLAETHYTAANFTTYQKHELRQHRAESEYIAEGIQQCGFSKLRLREMLVRELMRDCVGIEDILKAWNVDVVRGVLLGVMDNFAKQGNIHLTGKCAELMISFGPSLMLSRSFNIMLAACMGRGDVSAALQWWGRFTNLGVDPSLITFNTMIQVCTRGKDVHQAEWWMEQLIESGIQPCLKSFTTLIVAYGQSGAALKAETWYRKMRAHGLRADAVLHNAVIDMYAKNGDVTKAEMWFKDMQAEGVPPNQRTFNSLIRACVKSGDLQRAQRWQKEMEDSGCCCDLHTYGCLIEGCVGSHDADFAEHLIRRMISEKLRPNLVCLRSLLKVYRAAKGCRRLAHVLALCVRDGGVQMADLKKVLRSWAARSRGKVLEHVVEDVAMLGENANAPTAR
eukprot:TRINITY_DN7349_c0_g6_i1.p1 TRINITY_DN7349_c0_g6~~TRINITY_DN7349_c0_g6_i1.p1  ORF type:complete len:676 (+),score=71.32 TRINITY_DN7349_c0_g6_i1:105-2132(+)